MWCVIPAAGKGTRLASARGGRPKALLDVGGTTLIMRLLRQLGPKVDRACIVVPPKDDRIPAVVGRSVDSLRVSYARQPQRRGVGHAVLQAREQVEGAFLVVMGDAFYAEPLEPFVDAWLRSSADGAVLVEPLGAPDLPMGRVRVEGGRVASLEKTRATEGFTHTLAGCLILPETAFATLAETEPAASGEVELESAVSEMLTAGYEFVAVPYDGWRTNVNRPADLRTVEARLNAPAGQGLSLDDIVIDGSLETE